MLAQSARRALFVLVAAHALVNAARLFLALRQAALLPELPVSLPPQLQAAFGALWMLVFAGCAAGIWTQRTAAARVTICAAVAYQASFWMLQIAFAQASFWAQAGFGALGSMATLIAVTVPAIVWQRSAQAKNSHV